MSKKISTSALGRLQNRRTSEVFEQLLEKGLIARSNDAWELTEKGKELGGEYRENKQFGRYVVWPENLFDNQPPPTPVGPMLSSTKVGVHFELSPNRINKLLAEIGWITKAVKGWQVTETGLKVGGFEKNHHKTGIPYVVWPETILENRVLVENVDDNKGVKADAAPEPAPESPEAREAAAFREKFEAKYRATDGHYVRSRGELAIDNWLYMSGLVHAYERKLPIEQDVYCDFYLPGGKVYIEYWGMEDNEQYARRKREKLEVYARCNYNLIELVDEDIFSLDDVMPRKLLRFGISAD